MEFGVNVYYISTIRLVFAYRDAYKCSSRTLEDRLIIELCVRLRQLSYLYDSIQTDNAEMLREDEADRPPTKPGDVVVSTMVCMHTIDSPDSMMGSFRQDERLHLNLETFYYIAHRIRKLLQTAGERLPGVSRFECLSIARTRNDLIEHPDSRAGTETVSLCLSNQGGPFLKGAKRSDEVGGYRDEGFSHNAAAFRSSLNEWFREAISGAKRRE